MRLRDRRHHRTTAFGYAAWLTIVVAASAGCAPAKDGPSASQAEPFVPPAITLASPREIRETIEAAKGNVVVVNFWATWCPPCVKEMPELARFWREFDGRGVTFLSISADHHSTRDQAVVPFVNSYEIPFPVRIMYVDNPDEVLKEITLTWEGRQWDGALPATFIIDREGHQVWSTVGEVDRDLLAEKVGPLLAASAQ